MPDGSVGMPSIEDAENLQGFPRGWTLPAEANARRSVRWRLVGNAVSVSVVEWLASRLSAPSYYDDSADGPLRTDCTWPDAAWGSATSGRFKSAASHYPHGAQLPELAAFLANEMTPLSRRATQGFLGRARKGNLRYPHGFLARLEQHAERLSP